MTTIEYLYQNENCVVTGIQFTISDLVYLKENKLQKLTINYEKPTAEEMTEVEVISRLIELYKLASATNVKSGILKESQNLTNLAPLVEEAMSRVPAKTFG